MEILTYPSYLSNDEYALRKVTITAMRNDACQGEVEQMLNKAINTVDSTITPMWNDYAHDNKQSLLCAPEGFTSMGAVVLPIPAQLNDESSHSWNTDTSIVSTVLNNAVSTATAGLSGMARDAGSLGKIAESLASGVTLDKILATGAMLTGRRKPLIDPGYFQNYTGSQPRSFNLSWVLIPQNSDDSKAIHNIIITLKKWASPSKAIAGVVMLSPYFFNIQFSNPIISEMMKMDNCVCTGVDCSYSSQVFPDGMPKQINLTLRLNESQLTYADNYNNSVGASSKPNTAPAPVKYDVPKAQDNPVISPVNAK